MEGEGVAHKLAFGAGHLHNLDFEFEDFKSSFSSVTNSAV